MKTRLFVGLAALGLLMAACGGGSTTSHAGHQNGTAAPSQRTVEIEMRDTAFAPTVVDVKVGDAITFAFTNKGAIRHEALLGDEKAQQDHAIAMSAASASEMHDHGASALTLEPGQSGELTHTFDTKGTLLIGCHEPGHYDAGMHVTITVS